MRTLKLTKKYEKYPEYKDSDVEWLGRIPKEWESKKIATIFDFPNQKVTEATHEPLSVTYSGIKKQIENAAKVAEGSLRKHVKIGDLVINGRSDRKGAVGMSEYEGGVSLVYNVLRKRNKELDSKYFHYLFRSKLFSEEFYRWGRGIVDDLWTTRESEMKRIIITIPKQKDQSKIANYLDEKTFLIDQIIEKKQKLIELLKEKRSETINSNVNAVHGRTEKLKYIATERKIKFDTAPADSRYVGLENVESFTGKVVDSKEKMEPESSVNLFHKGDVLFGKLRPYLTKVLSVDFDGVCSGEFLILTPKKEKIISKYLFYKLLSKDFIKTINDSTYGTKMPRANGRFIGNQVIIYPSLDAQIKIVKSLDHKMEIFEKLICDISRSVDFLQEFKTSLISNVVTGNIKI